MWIGASAEDAGLSVIENGIGRIDLGRDDQHGNYRLKFLSPSAGFVAGIGESADGSAVASVAGLDGTVKAQMAALVNHDGKGSFVVGNGLGKPEVAVLTEGANQEGLLQLFSGAGEKMVEAGGTAEGIGVVRAGPEAFKPGYGLLGLPGSYLAGKR